LRGGGGRLSRDGKWFLNGNGGGKGGLRVSNRVGMAGVHEISRGLGEGGYCLLGGGSDHKKKQGTLMGSKGLSSTKEEKGLVFYS